MPFRRFPPRWTRWLGRLWVALVTCLSTLGGAPRELLNVSYDPTREFFGEFNAAFVEEWKQTTGETVIVRLSNGGSSKQARSVMDGLRADVVTLALGYDIDAMAIRSRLVPTNWQSRLPSSSAPYTSTIVFLVRKGNPKGIRDWNDLIKPDVAVITPNPKTSGGARWNYLAAWAYALQLWKGDTNRALDFMVSVFRNVPVLDTGARGSTATFVQRGIGDVLITWETEAMLAQKELGAGKFEVVVPSLSILAEPPVAVVERNTKRNGTDDLARAYLGFLYTETGQEIAAKHFYRPRMRSVADKYATNFPKLHLVTVEDAFGGWAQAHRTHFAEGGTFEQVQRAIR